MGWYLQPPSPHPHAARPCRRWAWCAPTAAQPKRCETAAYLQATHIVWNVLLCLMLFCLANLLKVGKGGGGEGGRGRGGGRGCKYLPKLKQTKLN